MTESPAALNQSIESSVNGLAWRIAPATDDEAAELALAFDLPEIVARILSARGQTPTTAGAFLNSSLKTDLPDPSLLNACDKAAELAADFIIKGKTIGIFGDYDVDGATSTALLYLFLEAISAPALFAIPSREAGYGPNLPQLESLQTQGAELIITVDCGTSAAEILGEIGKKTPVIVLDHHEPNPEHTPSVAALVNPKSLTAPTSEAENPFRNLAAVGVVFMFVVALNRTLRKQGFYSTSANATPEPSLASFLDLVALGTVCDVCELKGLNRLLVKSGLKVMQKRGNLGLTTLADLAGIKSAPSVYHLGFALGPRLNAAGRIGASDIGTKLLTTHDPDEADKLAKILCSLNTERQELEAAALLEAIEQIESGALDAASSADPSSLMAFAFAPHWHKGIIGIVAGRLKERYHLPSFVLTKGQEEETSLNKHLIKHKTTIIADETEDTTEVHGSCRSIHGIDIGAIILDGVSHGILTAGGGHTMAAGFSLPAFKVPEAQKFFAESIAKQMKDSDLSANHILTLDGVLALGGISTTLLDTLALLEPYGEGNPEPLFLIPNVNLFFLGIRGAGHIAVNISSPTSSKSIKGIAFKAADTALGSAIMNSAGETFHLVGRLHINEWQGRRNPEVTIIDLAKA